MHGTTGPIRPATCRLWYWRPRRFFWGALLRHHPQLLARLQRHGRWTLFVQPYRGTPETSQRVTCPQWKRHKTWSATEPATRRSRRDRPRQLPHPSSPRSSASFPPPPPSPPPACSQRSPVQPPKKIGLLRFHRLLAGLWKRLSLEANQKSWDVALAAPASSHLLFKGGSQRNNG